MYIYLTYIIYIYIYIWILYILYLLYIDNTYLKYMNITMNTHLGA